MDRHQKFITLDEKYLSRFDEVIVIGDIHGCSNELEELLKKVSEDSTSQESSKCLKILVGDLVNKGPNNKRVLEICCDKYKDSIISVRGNHDEIVLDQYKAYKSGSKLSEKNNWIKNLPPRYIRFLESLPYTISIPSLNCIIVHAGLDPSIANPSRCTPFRMMTTMRNIVVETSEINGDVTEKYRCTKSEKEGTAWASFWTGPEHVYFGHDARRRLQNNHKYATGLDTGCVYGDRLSYVYIKGERKGEILSIKAKEIYEATSDTETPNQN